MAKVLTEGKENILKAFEKLGFKNMSLGENFEEKYADFKWYVIPHWRVETVIYSVPADKDIEQLPWESWYLDGGAETHHVHYAKQLQSDWIEWIQQEWTEERPDEVIGKYWYWYDDNGLVTAICPEYCLTAEELPARRVLYQNGIQDIVDYAEQADTTLGRLLRANDYICVNYCYDYDLEIRRADDVIETGECVCEGYTALYTAALRQMDIPVTFVLSDPMNHIWNAVNLDGNWYHIDVTWNDPSYDEIAIPQLAYHNNFILSDQGITNAGHSGWTTFFTAASTKYDNAFWVEMQQAAAMDGDVVYYAVEDDSNAWYQHIYAYDLTNGTQSRVHSYDYDYYGYPSHVWVAKDVLYYIIGPAMYALPASGGTAQRVFQVPEAKTCLFYPFQKGDVLYLYSAEWLYYTDGELLSYKLSSEIKPLEPEETVYTVEMNQELSYLHTGNKILLWATLYPRPDESYSFVWTSSDPETASVDDHGLVTAHSAGVAEITASYGKASGSCTLAVCGTGEMRLPAQTSVIEANAFSGVAARCIIVPEQVQVIGSEAFAHTATEVICLPASLEDIASDAFWGNDDVILVVPQNSIAEFYAMFNNFTYVNPW